MRFNVAVPRTSEGLTTRNSFKKTLTYETVKRAKPRPDLDMYEQRLAVLAAKKEKQECNLALDCEKSTFSEKSDMLLINKLVVLEALQQFLKRNPDLGDARKNELKRGLVLTTADICILGESKHCMITQKDNTKIFSTSAIKNSIARCSFFGPETQTYGFKIFKTRVTSNGVTLLNKEGNEVGTKNILASSKFPPPQPL